VAITPEFIRAEVEQQSYELSLHADDERIADGLTIAQLEAVLLNCNVIEEYPDDPRGESCLVVSIVGESRFMLFVEGIGLVIWYS
jgi:hypothetical protein